MIPIISEYSPLHKEWKLRIWSHLLKKPLMDFIFCAVRALSRHPENSSESSNGCGCSLLYSDFNMT